MRPVWSAALAAVLMLPLAWGAGPANAQGTGRSLDLDPSVRAAGMGGATTAVTWGEPGTWGNPAAVAGYRGAAWLGSSTRLAPGLAGDVELRASRFVLGGAGLGLTLMGEPSWLGRVELDYGSVQGTDPLGNATGTFDTLERIEGWGAAIAPFELVDALRRHRDPDVPSLARWFDLRGGWQRRRADLRLAPGTSSRESQFDWGAQARVALLPGRPDGRAPRVEVAGGWAVLSADRDVRFDFGGTSTPGAATRHERRGVAAHAVVPWAGEGTGGAGPWGWWFATVPQAVELGFAWDHDDRTVPGSSFEASSDHVGFEASVMRILFARLGQLDDPREDVSGLTWGFGVHLPVGLLADVGYDFASVPNATGIERGRRHGWSVALHPEELLRRERPAR